MATRTYTVTGMTCGHCEQAVRTEVGAVTGVTDVAVDHASGRLEVTGDADEAAVLAAVVEAGYQATPAS
jgi:copper chaperone CopZ